MSDKESLTLAALLHDIGKFWERTEVKSEEVKRFYSGKYSHSWWGALFVEEFPFLFSEPNFIQHLIQYHHNPRDCPESLYAKIIHIADRLSSMEREEAEDRIGLGKSEVPLISIFSQIKLDKEKPAPQSYALTFLDLQDKKIFPNEQIKVKL